MINVLNMYLSSLKKVHIFYFTNNEQNDKWGVHCI